MKVNIKKSISLLLAVIMIIATVPMTSLASKTSGKLTYSVEGGKAIIVGCKESAKGKITIPSKIDGYPVTRIGVQAFYECTDVTSVTIPDSVTSIGTGAFECCLGLTSITIPNSVKSIESNAFVDCTGLKNITISDSVTSISSDAFYNTAYYNTSSNWEKGVLYIGKYLIRAKKSVSGKYTIKSGTICIADNAFGDMWSSCCENLTSVVIPDSVRIIGDGAFEYCEKLKIVINGSGVKSIGEGAFWDCYALENITLSNKLTAIKENVFGYCNIKEIAIPKSVKKIEEGAFLGCNLKKIYGYKGTVAETYAKKNNITFINAETHDHSYTYTVTVKATTSKAGSITGRCKCGADYTKSIPKIKSVTLSNDTFTYNGKVKQPTVTVKDSKGNKLKKGTDYTVKYSSGRKNVGKYTVTVTFKGKYSGTKKLTFKIKPKGTSISKLTAGTKKFTVNIKKQATQTTGYQVQYSKNSSMKSATTKTYASTSKTSRTISNLKAKTKYYVRVRTYKNVKINGKTYKYFSTWSSIKSVKTK